MPLVPSTRPAPMRPVQEASLSWIQRYIVIEIAALGRKTFSGRVGHALTVLAAGGWITLDRTTTPCLNGHGRPITGKTMQRLTATLTPSGVSFAKQLSARYWTELDGQCADGHRICRRGHRPGARPDESEP